MWQLKTKASRNITYLSLPLVLLSSAIRRASPSSHVPSNLASRRHKNQIWTCPQVWCLIWSSEIEPSSAESYLSYSPEFENTGFENMLFENNAATSEAYIRYNRNSKIQNTDKRKYEKCFTCLRSIQEWGRLDQRTKLLSSISAGYRCSTNVFTNIKCSHYIIKSFIQIPC